MGITRMKVERNRKFLVLTTPRSGSAWLISVLNNVDGVSAYGGIFIQKKREEGDEEWDSDFAYPRFIEATPKGARARPFSIFSYLDTLYNKPGVVGFKLMYCQLMRYPELLGYFIYHQIPVIHLIRRNHLDVLISRAMMRKTKQAHPLSDQPEFHQLQVELDPENLVKGIRIRHRNILIVRNLLRWSRLSHLEVVYEDLVQNPSSFQRICDFLAVKSREKLPQSRLVKIQKRGHADVISNYREVKEVLAGTQFAHLIQ